MPRSLGYTSKQDYQYQSQDRRQNQQLIEYGCKIISQLYKLKINPNYTMHT
jgi:hypothetical protein